MYTAADIRNVEFTKNMGGYKVSEIEVFVDACADTVEALTAEKEELNKKLAILADKLVEYRRDEDSIRSALLSAQRMGDSVVRDANEQAEKILAAANEEAASIVAAAKNDIVQYEEELARVKQEVSNFKAGILSLYKEHLALLKSVPDMHTEEAAAPTEQTVVEPVSDIDDAPVRIVEEEDEVIVAPEGEETAPKSKFANLKFGEDYNLDDDED